MKHHRPAPRCEGDPCARCGTSLRYTRMNRCVKCFATRSGQSRKPPKKAWAIANRERYLKSDHYRARTLANRYGVAISELPPRPEDGRCECCARPDLELCLDHSHALDDLGFPMAETFRGWLCHDCNLGIGRLGDDIPGVARALAYLERKA